MKDVKKLQGKDLENFIVSHKGLIAAFFDRDNSYYCNTCDGLRVKGHECYCMFCRDNFPDTDKHNDCPILKKKYDCAISKSSHEYKPAEIEGGLRCECGAVKAWVEKYNKAREKEV